MHKKNICNLCGSELTQKNRCKAHIILEFIWREYMKEGDERENMVLLKSGNAPARFLKSYGITDDSILCRKCDDEILGKYENDFRKIWGRVFKSRDERIIEQGNKLFG